MTGWGASCLPPRGDASACYRYDAFADEHEHEHEQVRLAREAADQHQKNFEKSEELRKAAELRAKKAEEDLVALQALVQPQLTATDHKGYDKGYDKATVEY